MGGKFFNADSLKAAWTRNSLPTILIAAFGIATLFFDSYISSKIKAFLGISYLVVYIITFFVILYKINTLESIMLTKNSSKVEVKFGNIFEEETNVLKLIPFNEYFDTIVDDEIIAEKSLNGKYLKEQSIDIEELNRNIANNQHLKNKKLGTVERKKGKKTNYELGTIFKNEDYLLLAFSKFTKDNRAELTQAELTTSLLNMWDEIDAINAGKSIAIPLLGSNMLRIKNNLYISNQEILEMLLLTFQFSRIKMKSGTKVTIILHESLKNEIELYKLK